MDKNLNELYQKINIPEDLDRVIEDAIKRERNYKVITMKSKNKLFKSIGAAAASFVLLVALSANANYAFAQEVYKMPIIGKLAKLMTIREYNIENDTSMGKVTIPNIEGIENKEVEALINDTITKKVDAVVAEQAILDAEYKEAYIETGGTEENYHKVEMTVDYQPHYISDNIISFEIFKYQTLASAYNERYPYTIDLGTGKELKLKDVIKSDYDEVKDILVEKLEGLMASDEDELNYLEKNIKFTKQLLSEEDPSEQEYLKQMVADFEQSIKDKDFSEQFEGGQIEYDIDYVKNMDIDDTRMFYVRENGDVVFIFSKYEIAGGAVGDVEIVIGNIAGIV